MRYLLAYGGNLGAEERQPPGADNLVIVTERFEELYQGTWVRGRVGVSEGRLQAPHSAKILKDGAHAYFIGSIDAPDLRPDSPVLQRDVPGVGVRSADDRYGLEVLSVALAHDPTISRKRLAKSVSLVVRRHD